MAHTQQETTSIKSHLLSTSPASPKYGSGTDSIVNISNLSQSPIHPTSHTLEHNDHEVKYNNNESVYPLLSPETNAPSPQHASPYHHGKRGGSPSTINLGSPYTKSHQQTNPNNKHHNRLRSIPEVKSYLEHFIPELTSQTVLTCLIVKPILISINIFFIGYQFFWFLFSSDPFGTGRPSPWTRALQIVIVSFEFVGLIGLVIIAGTAACKNYFSVMTDCIRLMGSWSVFRLFYRLRPLALFEYLSVMITHNANRVEKNSAKIEKWKKIVSDLDIEIEHCPSYMQSNLFGIDVDKMKETRSNLLQLIEIEKRSKNEDSIDTKSKKSAVGYHKKVMDEHYISASKSKHKRYSSKHLLSSLNLTDKRGRHGHKNNFLHSMVYISTWFILITLLIIALFIGVLSLVLKLSMFNYVGRIELMGSWNLNQWFLFLFFVNQIWNISDLEKIKIETLYKFLFVDHRVKYSRYVSQRMCMLDSVIKEELWRSHGYRGLLFAINLNSEIVQKILIKPDYDLNTDDLIQYKQIIESRQKKNDVRLNHNSYESDFEINPLNDELSKVDGLNADLDVDIDLNHQKTVSFKHMPSTPQLEKIVSGTVFEDEEFTLFKSKGTHRKSRNHRSVSRTTNTSLSKLSKTAEPFKLKMSNFIDIIKTNLEQYEQWLKMSEKHPPQHPYATAKKELKRFANKMDSMSKKVFIVTSEKSYNNCNNTMTIYHDYKLMACKEKQLRDASTLTTSFDLRRSTAGSGNSYHPKDTMLTNETDISTVSLISIKTAAFINTLQTKIRASKVDSFAGNNAVMLEPMKGSGGFNDPTIYMEIHENVLMHKIVLFEYLEKFLSVFGPFIMIIITIATITTTVLSMLDKQSVEQLNDECPDNFATDRKTLTLALDWTYLILAAGGFLSIIIYTFRFVNCCNCALNSKPALRRRRKRRRTKWLTIVAVILWILMTAISWIRLIYYLALPLQCKQAIIKYDPLVFASVIGDGLFALFMSAVIVITLISHYVVMLILIHLALLNLFYWFGWNFIVGIISESGSFLLHELGINQNDDKYASMDDKFDLQSECTVRMWLSTIACLLFILYFIFAWIEMILHCIVCKTQPNSFKKHSFKKSKLTISTVNGEDVEMSGRHQTLPHTQPLRTSTDIRDDDELAGDIQSLKSFADDPQTPPRATQSLPGIPGYHLSSPPKTRNRNVSRYVNRTFTIWDKSRNASNKSSFQIKPRGWMRPYIMMKRFRYIIVFIFYLVATFHLFFALIISNDNSKICDQYDVIHQSQWYSSKYEVWFSIIMWIDLLLFGKLFKSYDILFDPIFWTTGVLWNYTNNIKLSAITLTLTFCVFGFLAYGLIVDL